MVTKVRLPRELFYPIEVVKLLAHEGDSVKKRDPILKFKYWNRVPDGVSDDGSEQKMVTQVFYEVFESPFEGKVLNLQVKVGDRIADHLTEVMSIQEPCDHSVQFGGLCALCGAELDNQDYMGYSDTARAPIAMSHGTQGLTVSRTEAERIENSSTQRLLGDRKLILVVDLDQTVIHAAVDPEIGKWIADESSPNHEAVKEVKSFVLREPASLQQPRGNDGECRYYVKLRSGLAEFFEEMSTKYEMHIYTMATKSYAAEIARIIDPDGRFFADRILSRDESGNLMQKDLHRLFPVTQAMVVIIDDRGDVWRWSSHLLRVAPYHFFSGTGDINSVYLPKRSGLVTPEGEENASEEPSGRASEQAANDHELTNVGRALNRLHTEYYEKYQSGNNDIPDIGKLLPLMKRPVFDGCVFLFSGLFPLGTPLDAADIVQWVRSFGAVVVGDYVPSITHVIAKGSGTIKVRQGAGAKKKIVRVEWIFACLEAWKQVPTEQYEILVADPLPPPNEIPEAGSEPQREIAAGFVRSLSRGEVDWDDEELLELVPSSDEELDENAIAGDEEEHEVCDGNTREWQNDDSDVRSDAARKRRHDTGKNELVVPKSKKVKSGDDVDDEDNWIAELEKDLS